MTKRKQQSPPPENKKKRPLVHASLAAAFLGGSGGVGGVVGSGKSTPPAKKRPPPPSATSTNKTAPTIEQKCCSVSSSSAANAITKSTTLALASSSSSPQRQRRSTNTTIAVYCDLDGVLVDFNNGVERLFMDGRKASDIPPRELWARIGSSNTAGNQFWSRLHWTRDGEELWNFLVNMWLPPLLVNDDAEELPPAITELKILTGVSRQKGVGRQKFHWCKRELNVECQHFDMAAPKGQHRRMNNSCPQKAKNNTIIKNNDSTTAMNKKDVNYKPRPPPPPSSSPSRVIRVITCWSKNKHYESGPGRILIDDRTDLRSDWEAKGGIFILHTSTKNTMGQLKHQLGLVQK